MTNKIDEPHSGILIDLPQNLLANEEIRLVQELCQRLHLQALATLLNKPDLFIREEILRQVYENPTMRLIDFVRHVLDVQRQPSREERIEAAIQRFLHEHPGFNSIQRRFVYTLQSVLMLQSEEDGQDLAAFTSAHLMQAPFNRIGKADDLFSAHELAELVQFANNQVA